MSTPHLRAGSFALAGTTAVLAWWFDYSDRVIHGAIALVIAACSFAVPKIAASTAALWLTLGVLGHVLSPLPTPGIAEGTTETEVLRSQGMPMFRGSVESLNAQPEWGYALPNPRRLHHATDVLVYHQPGGVLYLFTAKGRVVVAKSGGS